MKMTGCFEMAWLSNRRHEKNRNKMIVIFILILFFGTVTMNLNRMTDYVLNSFDNMYCSSMYAVSVGRIDTEERYGIRSEKSNTLIWDSGCLYDEIDCVYDGSIHTGQAVTDNEETEPNVFFRFACMDSESLIFSSADEREFAFRFPEEKMWLGGGGTLNAGEIVLTEDALQRFGIDDREEAIGKKISFVNKKTEEVYLKDLVVSGVINSDVRRCSGLGGIAPVMVRKEDARGEAAEAITGSVEVWQYYGVSNQDTVHLQQRIISDSEISMKIDNPDVYLYELIYKLRIFFEGILSKVLFLLLCMLIVGLLCTLFFYQRKSETYHKLLVCLGMKDKSMFFVLLFETIQQLAAGLFVAEGLVVLFVYGMNCLFEKKLLFRVNLSAGPMLGTAVGIGFLLLIVCVAQSYLGMRSSKTETLIQTE